MWKFIKITKKKLKKVLMINFFLKRCATFFKNVSRVYCLECSIIDNLFFEIFSEYFFKTEQVEFSHQFMEQQIIGFGLSLFLWIICLKLNLKKKIEKILSKKCDFLLKKRNVSIGHGSEKISTFSNFAIKIWNFKLKFPLKIKIFRFFILFQMLKMIK